MNPAYEPVLGLEIHIQLKTHSKLFCPCENRSGGDPNSRICPICLGHPGTLPSLNRAAVELAIKLALALEAEVQPVSRFARKNYFYPDLPKGYQISQYEEPLAVGGFLPLLSSGKPVPLRRLHLEEDAGKLLHELPGGGALPGLSLVDYNRCGVPLVEMVTEPALRSSAEADELLRTLQALLLALDVSEASLEDGSLRCDANISLRPRGAATLGTKCEIKNLNSFRHLVRAIESEVIRQQQILEAGQTVAQETRGFDVERGQTFPMRSKEEADDYRYFPEPDLRPLLLEPSWVEELRKDLPERPWERQTRYATAYGLEPELARDLALDFELATYLDRLLQSSSVSPRTAAHWVRGELVASVRARKVAITAAPPPARMGEVLELLESGAISGPAAKTLWNALWDDLAPARELAGRLGLLQERDPALLEAWVEEVLREHPRQLQELRSGKEKVLGFFVGRVLQRSAGKADPKAVRERLQREVGVNTGTDSSTP